MMAVAVVAYLAVMGVLAAVAVRLQPRAWLAMDAALIFCWGGATIAFAEQALQGQTKGVAVDQSHVYLVAVVTVIKVLPALCHLLMRQSRDPSCVTAVLTARVTGVGLATLLLALAHLYSGLFTEVHLYYAVLGHLAWAAVSAYHLSRDGTVNKRGVESKVDFFLKVDVAMTTAYSLLFLLTPEAVLGLCRIAGDSLHAHLLQLSAAFLLGTAALSWLALRFDSVDNKRAVLMSRMATLLGLWAIRTYLWLAREPTTSFFTYFMACLAFLPFFPAYVGIRISK